MSCFTAISLGTQVCSEFRIYWLLLTKGWYQKEKTFSLRSTTCCHLYCHSRFKYNLFETSEETSPFFLSSSSSSSSFFSPIPPPPPSAPIFFASLSHKHGDLVNEGSLRDSCPQKQVYLHLWANTTLVPLHQPCLLLLLMMTRLHRKRRPNPDLFDDNDDKRISKNQSFSPTFSFSKTIIWLLTGCDLRNMAMEWTLFGLRPTH